MIARMQDPCHSNVTVAIKAKRRNPVAALVRMAATERTGCAPGLSREKITAETNVGAVNKNAPMPIRRSLTTSGSSVSSSPGASSDRRLFASGQRNEVFRKIRRDGAKRPRFLLEALHE
jgi:hypothetical protein